MELTAIEPSRSSQLAGIGFDNSQMYALFRRGGLYEYDDVTAEEFNEVLNASRPGDVFRDRIKGHKTYRKVEVREPIYAVESPAAAELAPAPEAAVVAEKELEVKGESTKLVSQASVLAVTDVETQAQASELLLTIASMRQKIADTWKPMKEAAFNAHRTICAKEKELDTPLALAERTLKDRIGGYVQEQQRIAREREEALRRQERERAEAEAKEESERLALEDAVSLADEGRMEEAEAVLNHPLPVAARYVAPAPVAPAVAQVKGVNTREVWKFRIVDEAKIPREYLTVNESAIGVIVSRTKGKVRIPGVEAYPEQQVAASRR